MRTDDQWSWLTTATTPALVAAALALLVLPAPRAEAAGSRGTLSVSVAGLPRSTAADATLSGHGKHAKIRGKRVFRRLATGRYVITVRQVRLRRAAAGVPKGSRVLASSKRIKVVVTAGKTTKAVVRYGTIINARVSRAPRRVLKTTGPAGNPKSITVSRTSSPRVGQILTSGPTKALPAGLLHRVVRVRADGRRAVVRLKPVGLYDALPQIDLDTTATFDGRHAGRTRAHTAAAPTLGLTGSTFGCQAPLSGGYHIGFNQSFGAKADVSLHVPKKFGIPVGLPDGKFVLSLSSSAGFDVALPKSLGCSGSYSFPAYAFGIPVGPVVVPAYFRVVLNGSASVGDQGFTSSTSGGVTLSGGVRFHGLDVDPVASVDGQFNETATGGGKVSGGATLRFAIGVAQGGVTADVRADVKTAVSYSRNVDRSCAVELSGGVDLGVALGPLRLNQPLPKLTKPLYRCPTLQSSMKAPLAAFPGQQVPWTVKVTNTGPSTAKNATATITLPSAGSFASAAPVGTPAAPAAGAAYTVPLGDLAAGQTATATVRWKAPDGTLDLSASSHAGADNAPQTADQTATVPIGTSARCNPCGADFDGTGLRNRQHGAVTIDGVPPGATVGRAVLIWGILYDGPRPDDSITFDGHRVTADVAADVSGTLCWTDDHTVGYAADVTDWVAGNGTYQITDPPRGLTRPDGVPAAALPYTDGATLLVFYNGGGAHNQVLSDFTYNTNTDLDTGKAITRTFTGINSAGLPATLTLAGPDGQDSPEEFVITGADGTDPIYLDDPFDGSDHQDGPSFPIGNLWDTDTFDVTSVLPAGQQTLTLDHQHINDCIGVGAAVLQVTQP